MKETGKDGRVFYEVMFLSFLPRFVLQPNVKYELFTPYAQTGAHSLAAVSTSMVNM